MSGIGIPVDCCCSLLVEVAFGLTLGWFVQSDMVVAVPLYRLIPSFGNPASKKEEIVLWNLQ
jgi:hypothetical protein